MSEATRALRCRLLRRVVAVPDFFLGRLAVTPAGDQLQLAAVTHVLEPELAALAAERVERPFLAASGRNDGQQLLCHCFEPCFATAL
eukprot:2411227-Prymnesium_polylepis.1